MLTDCDVNDDDDDGVPFCPAFSPFTLPFAGDDDADVDEEHGWQGVCLPAFFAVDPSLAAAFVLLTTADVEEIETKAGGKS